VPTDRVLPDLTVALLQAESAPGDIEANVSTVVAAAEAAHELGARLLVLPELALTGYELDLLSDDHLWLTVDDPRLAPLRSAAVETGVSIVLTAALVLDDGTRQLAAVACLADGSAVTQGKQHLHGQENDLFSPGAPATETVDVDGWAVALAVCLDVAHPSHAAQARRLGADLYACSTLYTEGEERRIDVHGAARAMDNRMYSAIANHIGATGAGFACGSSGAWAPDGERIATGGTGAGLTLATLDAALLVVPVTAVEAAVTPAVPVF
jgi:predicted amidohydrolase